MNQLENSVAELKPFRLKLGRGPVTLFPVNHDKDLNPTIN